MCIPVILVRDSADAIIKAERDGRRTTRYPAWRQYLVIGYESCAIVHMKPAQFGGWRFDRVDIQGSEDWPRMTRDDIVAWKFQNDDGLTKIAELDEGFRERLLARARCLS